MQFINVHHERKFINIINLDNTHPKDRERLSLLYILAVFVFNTPKWDQHYAGRGSIEQVRLQIFPDKSGASYLTV